MKSIHTGDWHISIRERNEEWFIKRVVKLFQYIQEEDADELLITGDIFDKIPTALEIGLFIGFLQSIECPIYIVAGNHDRTKKPTIRADYLKNLLQLIELKNVTWATDKIVETPNYVLVPNYWIRQKKEIPVIKDKILLSHIRHELTFGNTTRKAEYDLEKLKDYKLVLLSDIHNTFKYSENIYYSTSPYRTNRKTITSLADVDNNFFGYNCIFNNIIKHREIHLPNQYLLKVQEKIGEINTNDLIDVEYQINIEDINEFSGENVVISRDNVDIQITENIYEVITEILTRDFKVKDTKDYIKILVDIVGDLDAN